MGRHIPGALSWWFQGFQCPSVSVLQQHILDYMDLRWNLTNWPEDQVHNCEHTFKKFMSKQLANCCTEHSDTSLILAAEQAIPAQSHTRYSASTIHQRISQLLIWHKGSWVACFCEWEMGLGEREGSANCSMCKEKMDFFFFWFKGVLLKPGLSTLIRKHMWQ